VTLAIGQREAHLALGQLCLCYEQVDRAEIIDHLDDLPNVQAGADHPRATAGILAAETVYSRLPSAVGACCE
jgi:hypothetical protein